MRLRAWARRSARLTGDDGATAVEYALMVGSIALVVIGSVGALGIAVNGLFAGVPVGL